MDSQALLDDLALEKSAKERFGIVLDVDSVIARHIAVGQSAHATIFLSSKKQLYCYIDGPAKLLLSDIKKIASRIGVKPELFFPPKGRPGYFDEVGRTKFREVFPGRRDIHDNDIILYRTLAPYSPALMLVSEVKDGVIYCADADACGGWRPVTKFTYRRIKTS